VFGRNRGIDIHVAFRHPGRDKDVLAHELACGIAETRSLIWPGRIRACFNKVQRLAQTKAIPQSLP
jgi:hypothetical protein